MRCVGPSAAVSGCELPPAGACVNGGGSGGRVGSGGGGGGGGGGGLLGTWEHPRREHDSGWEHPEREHVWEHFMWTFRVGTFREHSVSPTTHTTHTPFPALDARSLPPPFCAPLPPRPAFLPLVA
jgi:hypothetical protein